MIDYSVSAHPNPQDREAEPKYYASPQVSHVMSLADFSRHIASHGSMYGRSDIQAVIIQMVDCLREMLLEGKKVSLGEMGEFSLGFSSIGTLNAEDFNPNLHIKEIRVNWSPGDLFTTLKKDATFNLVANRRAQRLLLKAVTAGDNTVVLNDEDEL